MSSAVPTTMKVIEMTGPGGPEVLKLGERPVPSIEPGEVLIRVAAAGVNGPDLMQRKGLYPPPAGASDLLGLEVAGEIVAVGSAVKRWQPGDKVCALTNGGGYAQYCAVDAEQCLPIPHGVDLRDAAGLPETFFTVWSNLFIGVALKAGETLLVHGGAGGIGTTAIQLGKAFGCKVIATDSPESRCSICRDLGADRVIDYRQEDFVEVVRNEGGATLRTRPSAFKARTARELEARVWPEIANGRIRVVTGQIFPLAQAAQAHALMESSQHVGKILLHIE